MKVKPSGLTNHVDKGTLLDVEFINGMLFAFDVIVYRGMDLRGRITHLLKDRLRLVNNVVENFYRENQSENDCFPIYMKEYQFSDFESILTSFAENAYKDGIPRDGFIYTPVKECYPTKPKWNTLLKWKPSTLNSIDFLIKKAADDDERWDLFVGDKDATLVKFSEHPSITISHDDMVRLLGKYFSQESDLGVIECRWDDIDKTFVPIRKRFDKMAPNFITVALDVWESIQNPVHLVDLHSSSFANMRKFHNNIKSYLINAAVNEVANIERPSVSWADMDDDDDPHPNGKMDLKILDLACGRGGDLWKWSAEHAKAKNMNLHYIGVDIDQDLLTEAGRRSAQVVHKKEDVGPHERQIQHEFYRLDLRNQPYLHTKKGYFDIVSCQFAFHYFFETEASFEKFLITLKSNLKKDGIFIATLFDGERVYSLCERRRNKQLHATDNHGFEIQPGYDCGTPMEKLKHEKIFGIPITAVLLGDEDVILKEPTKEYLVFADEFIYRMRLNGFELVDSGLFENFDQSPELRDAMNTIEQAYSNLHRHYMFKYIGEDAIRKQEVWVPIVFEHMNLLERRCTSRPEVKELCAASGECFVRMLENITGVDGTGYFKESLENKGLPRISDRFRVGISVWCPNSDHVEHYRPSLQESLTYVWSIRVPDGNDSTHLHILGDMEKNLLFDRPIRSLPVSSKNEPGISHVQQEEDSNDEDENESEVNSQSDEEVIATNQDTVEEPDTNDDTPVGTTDKIGSSEYDDDNLHYKGRPINGGKDAWTIKALQEYARTVNIKIPSSVRRKNDIVTYLQTCNR